jgi:hypothetical protein
MYSKKMNKTALCLLILLCCLAANLFSQVGSTDESAIRKIVEQFTPMWTAQNGVEIFQNISSRTHYLFLSTKSILNRDGFIQLLSKMLQNNPPVKHTHSIKKILTTDSLAFEYGTMELVRKKGQTTKGESLNVFFREESGWKLIMNLPVAELRKVITD